ncbi:MAG TPA: nitroreductase family protein [Candidatus Krumholzibacteria bacterium]|nr:nitroreductase family protein [Candidatus Krumholzibacteria bacterium]
MEFDSVVRGRRSIRRYRSDAVSESEVRDLVDLARHAPSSMNEQPWHFVLVASADKKARLAEIKNTYCPPDKRHYRADFLRSAAWIVVVCVDRARSHGRAVETAVAATTTLLLAAHARGLGSVFMTAHAPDEPGLASEIRGLLGIPEGIDPVTLLPLGRPGETPAEKRLAPFASMIHVDTF